MKKKLPFIFKNFMVIIAALAAFGVASKVVNGAGNMPQFMVDEYESSIFVKSDIKTLAIITLSTVITIFLLFNFNLIKDGIHSNRILKGLIYGASFGIVWFFGFMELIIINHSEKVSSHLASGLRDIICLSVFGLAAGLLLCKNNNTPIKRKNSALVSIPLVSIFFAVFQGAQYYFTFKPVSEYQKISSITDVLWLLVFGAWIGFMYYMFRPGIRVKNRYLGALFFSYFIFGSNWLLYNFFYNIFLDIPAFDLILRCFTGCTGVFIGLLIHEYIHGRKTKAIQRLV